MAMFTEEINDWGKPIGEVTVKDYTMLVCYGCKHLIPEEEDCAVCSIRKDKEQKTEIQKNIGALIEFNKFIESGRKINCPNHTDGNCSLLKKLNEMIQGVCFPGEGGYVKPQDLPQYATPEHDIVSGEIEHNCDHAKENCKLRKGGECPNGFRR